MMKEGKDKSQNRNTTEKWHGIVRHRKKKSRKTQVWKVRRNFARPPKYGWEGNKRKEKWANTKMRYAEATAPYFGPLTTSLTFFNKLVFRPRPAPDPGDPGVPS